jgi:CHAT domain-containing protein
MRRTSLVSAALSLALSGALCGQVSAQSDPDRLSERAFEGAQWVLATQAARAVARVGARAAVGEGPLGDNIRARQALEEQLGTLRRALAEAVEARLETAKGLQEEVSAVTAALNRVDAEIRTEFPDYAELSNPRPLDYDDLRGLLGPDEALVLFLSDRTATFVWAISQKGVVWHRADLSAQTLSGKIRSLRADLDPTGPSRAAVSLSAPSGPRMAAFDGGTAYELYQMLLAPVMSVLEGVSHVFVVKDGALSSLPLSVLLTSPPVVQRMNVEELRAADWLMRRFAITTLPGVSSLASIRAQDRERKPSLGFVGFGDPVFSPKAQPDAPILLASRSIDAFFGAGGSRLDAIAQLQPLPGTARELRQIAGLFPDEQARVVLGAQATEAAVKAADLSGTAIVSFATHGLITGDISGLGEPALAFTPPDLASAQDDGLLTASEASQLALNADWVILSACNTAAGDGTPGAEGLSGLARAFLFAGARSILVSHWPVRDDVAGMLTTETLRKLDKTPGLARSEALRQAMLGVLDDESDPTLAHPSAWAPFVVVGDGGALELR